MENVKAGHAGHRICDPLDRIRVLVGVGGVVMSVDRQQIISRMRSMSAEMNDLRLDVLESAEDEKTMSIAVEMGNVAHFLDEWSAYMKAATPIVDGDCEKIQGG